MHGGLLSDLAVVTVVAAVTGMIAKRLGQPTILGYLLAGLIVGPYIPIPVFADPHRMEELAEVGVVLVMFAVGLEFRVQRLIEILPVSGLAAVVQIAALSWAGFTVGSVLGWSTTASVCLGATLAISSTMVVSAVLRTRSVDPDVRSHVFGILVVQDVVAIALMAVVTALASGQSVGLEPLMRLSGQLAAVIAVMLIGGMLILPRLVRRAVRQGDSEGVVVLAAGSAFGLAFAAVQFGYSAALGAFIAGMAVAESGRGHDVEHAIEALRSLFAAIFFVSIGMTVDPAVAWKSLPLALGLCAVVIGMQFVSVTVATVLSGSSMRRGIYSGIALGQVGELSFILASIGIGGGALPKETLPALVTVATVTTFTTPFLLDRALRIVDAFDRAMPDRGHQVLAAYHAFLRSLAAGTDGPSLRGPVLAVLLDWAALVILVVTHQTLARRVGLDQRWIADLGVGVLATPLLVGLIRSGMRVFVTIRARTGESYAARGRAVEMLVLVAVVVVLGLPTLALLRPLLSGPWGEVALVVTLLGALLVLGLRAGKLDSDHTSGVERLALGLAIHNRDSQELRAVKLERDLSPLAGIDYESITITSGATADGATLAQLDLRCRTGATVVAVLRQGATTTLPTGHERLEAQDVLAVSGSTEAIHRARALLTDITNVIDERPDPVVIGS